MNQGGGVYFTSDLHLGHKMVAGLRNFEDTQDHDQMIMDNWRRTIRDNDTVWVLGDIAMSDYMYALSCLSTLPGRKRLISGNHDAVHPMHGKKSEDLQKLYMEVFDSVGTTATRKFNGRKFMMSHFPYATDRESTEIRYMQYRLRDEGLWLLHGHLHMKTKVNLLQREIHVGVDAWDFTPVHVNTLMATLAEAEDEQA